MKKNNPILIAVLIAIIVVCALIFVYNSIQKSQGVTQNFQPIISNGEPTAGE